MRGVLISALIGAGTVDRQNIVGPENLTKDPGTEMDFASARLRHKLSKHWPVVRLLTKIINLNTL